jgi:hypothetical protein
MRTDVGHRWQTQNRSVNPRVSITDSHPATAIRTRHGL